jgi:putative methionine-R-sulfoxide reductase with GAF domain
MNEQNLPTKTKSPSEELTAVRERALLYSAFVASILGAIIFIIQVVNSLQSGQFTHIIPVGIAFLAVLLLTFFRSINFETRFYGLVGILTIIGITNLVQNGIFGDSRLYFLFAIFLVSLMTTRLISIIFAGVISLVMVGISVNILLGIIPLQNTITGSLGTVSEWILGILTLVLFAAIVIIVSDVVIRRFTTSLSNEITLATNLENERKTRNETIKEQISELTKRNSQRDLANQIARDIASLTDQSALLQKTVDLIRDRFGFYHAGVFLLDSGKEFAVLSSATGEAGKRMLEQKHKLRAGQEGIVGRAVGTGEPRIALDVGADAVHFRNPLLPETRSEMALPLRVGETVIGALDVQSQQESAFVKEDVDILQTIADQLAVGIERTRLLEKLESTVKDLTNVSESVTGQSWQRFAQKAGASISFTAGTEGEKVGTPVSAEATESMKSSRIVEKIVKVGRNEKLFMAIPLRIFGQTIGSLDLQFASTEIDEGTKQYYSSLADRLVVSLENARKNEETQVRANNEHLVRDLTTKVQSYTSIDDILKTAASELGRSLGLSEVEVGLLPPTEKQPEG